ncbi:MAG: CHAT domain-containing protein [Oscillatoriales cyanobacterium RM2_1_1]|nr:CHAT domain-containing protein [Oscillatoriales cyanobacterium SM2_3_0]NJO46664.1 CHAT domain-containing protein [Oscillatoriales cyanobacterium RM2_1_1]
MTVAQAREGQISGQDYGQNLLLGDSSDLSANVMKMEERLETEYENHFQRNLAEVSFTGQDIANILLEINRKTNTKSAVFWAIPEADYLHLVLVLPGQQPMVKDIQGLTREQLLQKVRELQLELTNPRKLATESYLPAAQKLYQWMIQPFEAALQTANVDTLLFCMGKGLRSLPIAVLHDGQQFLVEKYSLSLIPAFNLINTAYNPVKTAKVLAMGASEFTQLNPLPAVPIELSTIVNSGTNSGNSSGSSSDAALSSQWLGQTFLNQAFTLENLKTQLASKAFRIIHLATHAEFQSGSPKNSYIQFWDAQLHLSQMPELNWRNPSVELLVLSACRTALGNQEAELGFAGLALNSGVKSALASFWSVSDLGTLALMGEFYKQLKIAPSKAAALRQVQIGMIQGRVQISEAGLQLSDGKQIELPIALTNLPIENLSHPFYWAAFTMISSPW